MHRSLSGFLAILLWVSCVPGCSKKEAAPPVTGPTTAGTLDTTPPPTTVKILFIHHSVGCNWLTTGQGNLGSTLNANNYFVSDTNYDWNDPPSPPAAHDEMGDYTDTEDWPDWFNGSVMPYAYLEYANTCFSNTPTDPGGENEIVMFKSCYPNSVIGPSMTDEQAVYNGLLAYFAAHTEKMFVLCVPPPQITITGEGSGSDFPGNAAVTRQLANWLVDRSSGWLSSYTAGNVFVFDLYNVLTDPANHHRVVNGNLEHSVTSAPAVPAHPDELYYYTGGDSHPTSAGGQKATAEFVPLLNAWYRQWKGL